MEPIAKNIMVSNYHTIPSKATVAEAVRAFKEAGGPGDKRRVFGMMVVDEQGNLIGMLSMYDILVLLRPSLFVYQEHPVKIVGVLSFTDAPRLRSGSWRACLTTRIKIEDQGI